MSAPRRPVILSVDDREDVRYVRGRILRGSGFEVREAATGEEALALVAAEPFDLVLLDLKLPDLSGYEVCRRIKADPATADVVVLQISAVMTAGGDRVAGLESGADAFLAEPVEPAELVATVRTLLRVRHEQVSAPAPEAVGLRQLIGRQTRQLARLVDELLDVARIQSGKVTLARRPIDLRAVAERVRDTVRTAGLPGGHEIVLVADPEPVVVDGDAVRLGQVVGNLVDNAVKYSPGGGTIRIQVGREGERATLRVQDEGVGIAPKELERIFEPFAQLDQALDRPAGGLGLGLTVVRGLVEQHGGGITAASAGPGGGAEFIVWLPAVPGGPAADIAPPRRTGQPSRRIVVVEDYEDARQALETLLTLEGHRVETAADGERGLELIVAIRPDVAFIDIGLPGLDGYEVARRIRAATGRTPCLVALTGYGHSRDIERARQAGFDAHLVKPVDAEELGRLLAGVTTPGGIAGG